MMRWAMGVVLAAGMVAGVSAAEIFVAPTGKAEAKGADDDPYDLQTVLSGGAKAAPGTVVSLLGGEYRGEFTHAKACSGTAERPLIVRVARGARATILGGLRIEGDYTRFEGIEITNPNAVDAASFFNFYGGDGCEAVDLILHDNGAWRPGHNGIGCWSAAHDSTVYGCIVYNVGRKSSAEDRGSGGHGIYTQNLAATGRKQVDDNIFFRGVAWGIHAYGSSKAGVENFSFSRNIIFRMGSYGALVGGGAASKEIVFEDNCLYGNGSTTCCIGWGGTGSSGASIRGNCFAGKYPLLQFRRYRAATVRDNTFFAPQGGLLVNIEYPAEWPLPPYAWDDNTYFQAPQRPGEFAYVNQKVLDWAAWRKLGFDAYSTLTPAAPSRNVVRVFPSRYRAGRGNVVIYNWEKKPAVELDLARVLQKGKGYEILDVQDYFGKPLVAGVWREGPVTAPLPARDPSPEFAVFVVLSGDAIDYSGRGVLQPATEQK